MRLSLAVYLYILTSHFTIAADTLVVSAPLANLREWPSTDATVLLKLSQGRIVTELNRQDEWIEILIDNAVVKSGWLHSSVVSPVTNATENDMQADSAATSTFASFVDKFEKLNETTKNQSGFIPFTRAEISGNDTIMLIATPDWFVATQKQREDTLSAVFELWSNAVESGTSITVQVVDQNNEFHMVMFR